MSDKQIFKIVASALAVHKEPGGSKIGRLPKGITFEVEGDSRTEHLGSVWWKHSVGWSIEKTLDGTTVLLEPVGGSSNGSAPVASEQSASQVVVASGTTTAKVGAETQDAVAEVTVTITDKGPVTDSKPHVGMLAGGLAQVPPSAALRTLGSVRVRDFAGGEQIASLPKGNVVQADMTTLTEYDSYYWVRHTHGWSALQNVSGDQVFFEDAGDVYVPGPDGPKVEEMPGYQSLVTRHPVDIEQTNFFQYFGNNSFAYMKGRDFNYHRFAQGLHSGLDYGNNRTPGVPVYAGVHGTYVETLPDWKGRVWNRQLRVETKEGYLLIYQHIDPHSFTAGQAITPDTVLGTINSSFPSNGDHLHWEIRYNKQEWIVNPLALMLPELVAEVEKKYDPTRPGTGYSGSKYYYFYVTDEWTKWTTPTDQPVILRGGDPVDPRSLGA